MAWQELVRQIECRFVVKGFPNGMGVDPATGTVYVANFYGNTVSVIDGATSTVTATIGAGKYPDGVGVDPATATVYVANHFDNTVSGDRRGHWRRHRVGAENGVTAADLVFADVCGFMKFGFWLREHSRLRHCQHSCHCDSVIWRCSAFSAGLP